MQVTGVDPTNVRQHLDVGVRSGPSTTLGAHGIGVLQRTATENHWHVGDDVTVTFAETGVQHFTVALIYGLQNPLGGYTMSEQAFDANVAHLDDHGRVRHGRAGRVASTVAGGDREGTGGDADRTAAHAGTNSRRRRRPDRQDAEPDLRAAVPGAS